MDMAPVAHPPPGGLGTRPQSSNGALLFRDGCGMTPPDLPQPPPVIDRVGWLVDLGLALLLILVIGVLTGLFG